MDLTDAGPRMKARSKTKAWRWLSLTLFLLLGASLLVTSPGHHYNFLKRKSSNHDQNTALEERSFLSGLESAGESLLGKLTGSSNTSDESSIQSLVTNLFKGNISATLDGLIGELATPAGFLGTGIAQGVTAGIKNQTAAASTANGLNAVFQNFGSSLTSNLIKSMSASKSTASKASSSSGAATPASTATDDSSSPFGSANLNAAALALAQGLGGGTSHALNLSQAGLASFAGTNGLPGVAGSFGQGLTTTLLNGMNITSLIALVSSATKSTSNKAAADGTPSGSSSGSRGLFSSSSAGGSLAEIAAGLGTGLGQGASVGLGFQALPATNASGVGLSGAVQNLALGLTSGFLQNGTVGKLIASLRSGGSLSNSIKGLSSRAVDSGDTSSKSTSSGLSLNFSNANIGSVAQGLAVGLLDGVGNTLNQESTTATDDGSFDDSVGGAATGFGRGLGSQGTTLVKQILGNTTKAAAAINIKRSLSIDRRSSLTSSLNATTLDPILQLGLDAITCEGVGGLVAVALGLISSKTINLSSSKTSNTVTTTSAAGTSASTSATNQMLNVTNAGNTYSINIAKFDATINGNGLIYSVVVLVVHVLFAIIAYFIIAPSILILASSQSIATLSGRTNLLKNNAKWKNNLGHCIGAPTALVTFIFGIVAKGDSKQFSSAHEVLGLLTFLVTFALFAMSLYMRRTDIAASLLPAATSKQRASVVEKTIPWTTILTLLLATITLITGFVDLREYSLCIIQVVPVFAWLILSIIILGPLLAAIGILSIEHFLVRNATTVSYELGGEKGDHARNQVEKVQIIEPVTVFLGGRQSFGGARHSRESSSSSDASISRDRTLIRGHSRGESSAGLLPDGPEQASRKEWQFPVTK